MKLPSLSPTGTYTDLYQLITGKEGPPNSPINYLKPLNCRFT